MLAIFLVPALAGAQLHFLALTSPVDRMKTKQKGDPLIKTLLHSATSGLNSTRYL